MLSFLKFVPKIPVYPFSKMAKVIQNVSYCEYWDFSALRTLVDEFTMSYNISHTSCNYFAEKMVIHDMVAHQPA